MSKTICLVLEWKYPTVPLEHSSLHVVKDIIRDLKKQYQFSNIVIFTNNEECTFLLPNKIHHLQNLCKKTAKQNPKKYFKKSDSNYDCFLWMEFENQAKIHFHHSLLGQNLSHEWNELAFEHYTQETHSPPKKRVLIRADGGFKRGTGHLYRALTLAELLIQQGFETSITTLDNSLMNLGVPFFKDKNIPLFPIKTEAEFCDLVKRLSPDLLSLDILNIEQDFLYPLKNYARHIISFENLGNSAFIIDFTINDLYINPLLKKAKQLSGLKYSLLNQYFANALHFKKPIFNPGIRTILILFGGTDPSHLTQKALRALVQVNYTGNVILIQNFQQETIENLDYSFSLKILKKVTYMPQYMHGVDLAISSAGRSILELISMGIPTLCMSQNQKELMHTHSIGGNGVLNIGLGEFLDYQTIASYLSLLIENPELRKSLHQNALLARKNFSNHRIIKKITSLLKNN